MTAVATTSVTLADCFPAIFDQLPATLISHQTRKKMAAIACYLPARFLLTQIGFECPLRNGMGQADLLVAANRRQGGPNLLQQTARQALVNHTHPAWHSVAQLADVWQRNIWQQHMDDLWLEFDIASHAANVPNLFAGPDLATDDHEGWQLWHQEITPLLTGATVNADRITAMKHCVQSLPKAAKVFQIGAMRARARDQLRVCISHIYLDAILDYLQDLDIHTDHPTLRESLIWIQRHADAFTLHMDIPLSDPPRISLECYIDPRRNQRPVSERWRELFIALKDIGLAEAQQIEAILEYPRQIAATDFIGHWPTEALNMAHFNGQQSVLQRWIHHVKLDFCNGRPDRAKAYLAIGHIWV